MNLPLTRSVRTALALLALGGAALIPPAALAVDAQSARPVAGVAAPDDAHGAMRERMQHHMDQSLQDRLARLADRLEIRASQQGAWQKFSAAFIDAAHAHIPDAGHRPDAASDAASLARAHADHAARIAQAAARVADATAELQAALSADQRKVLDEVARQFAHHGFGHGAEGQFGPGMHGRMLHGQDEEHCDEPGLPGHPHGLEPDEMPPRGPMHP